MKYIEVFVAYLEIVWERKEAVMQQASEAVLGNRLVHLETMKSCQHHNHNLYDSTTPRGSKPGEFLITMSQ